VEGKTKKVVGVERLPGGEKGCPIIASGKKKKRRGKKVVKNVKEL